MNNSEIRISEGVPHSKIVGYFCDRKLVFPEMPSMPALYQCDSYPIYMTAEISEDIVGVIVGYYANRVIHIQMIDSDVPDVRERLCARLRYHAKQMAYDLVED